MKYPDEYSQLEFQFGGHAGRPFESHHEDNIFDLEKSARDALLHAAENAESSKKKQFGHQ